MDRFKAILRRAVSENCIKVELNENDHGKLYASENQCSNEGSKKSDKVWLDGILNFLFPKDQDIHSGNPTKGVLNIPNLGQVMIIASKGQTYKLSLYLPPNGEDLFQKEWAESKQQVSAEIKNEDVNVQPPQIPVPPPVPETNEIAPPPFTEQPVEGLNNSLDQTILPDPQNSLEFTMPPSQSIEEENIEQMPPMSAPEDIQTGAVEHSIVDSLNEPEFDAPEDLFSSSPIPLAEPQTPALNVDSGEADSELHQPSYSLDALENNNDDAPASIPFNNDSPQEQSEVFSQDYFSDLSESDDNQSDQIEVESIPNIAQPNFSITSRNKEESALPFDQITLSEPDSALEAPINSVPQPQVQQEPLATPQQFNTPTMESSFPQEQRVEPGKPIHIDFSSKEPQPEFRGGGKPPIDAILIEMINKRSSDLHLTIGQPIIYRIDGSIERMQGQGLSPEDMENYILPIMPEKNQREFLEISDTDFAYEITGVGRFRVNVFRDNIGVGAVLRHIPSEILTATQLGLPDVMIDLCKLSKGLVLVTGPTGSGKSTTLAAMVDHINKSRADHLLTIEDPIEFVHQQQKCLVNQREVGKHTKSFGKALKAALREDPDIILIGEMRDLETIHIAIETAETGHLVFGTLHTTTAVSTIDRIIDQFPSDQQSQVRMMLASSLKGVIAQTLLPKIGGGRVAAHEILIPNDAVGNMIREQKNHMIENHMQTQKADGNLLLNESLVKLVKEKVVSFEDAYIKAIDKKSFVEMAGKKGLKGKAVA